MFVCICKGVTENKIREAIRAGAQSVEEVKHKCGAGTDCGTCILKLYRIVRDQMQAEEAASEQEAV